MGKNCLRQREKEENEDSQCLTILGHISSGPTTLLVEREIKTSLWNLKSLLTKQKPKPQPFHEFPHE